MRYDVFCLWCWGDCKKLLPLYHINNKVLMCFVYGCDGDCETPIMISLMWYVANFRGVKLGDNIMLL